MREEDGGGGGGGGGICWIAFERKQDSKPECRLGTSN
jgi:hypothetical protein